VGVVTYPAGWDAGDVKRTCGTSAGRYELGDCGLRWAYLLAVIGCLDAIILAALAFILATRHVRLQAEPGYTTSGSLYKGEGARNMFHEGYVHTTYENLYYTVDCKISVMMIRTRYRNFYIYI
jgi:hypothetical protein